MKTVEVLERVLKGKRVKPITLMHYRQALGSLAEYSEAWPASGLVINEWLNTLGNYADTTVKMWFEFVSSAGRYVEKMGGKDERGLPKYPNPCNDADRPKVAKKRRRYFTPEELVRVISACRFGYDRELILALIDSTCRIGELSGLCGRDVGEGFINVSGKTGERRYRLDSRICSALKVLAGSDDGLVFKGVTGRALSSASLGCRVVRVIKRAGLAGKKLGPHTLRHSGASLVAKETGSALAVKALLQHDDIKTSMGYIHDAEEVIQQKISPLQLVGEKVFGEGGMYQQKQIPMIAGEGESEFKEVEGAPDFSEDMFPAIEDGKEIRPLLKTEDLRLIRKAFVEYARSGDNHDEVMKGRELMKRILRRPKIKNKV